MGYQHGTSTEPPGDNDDSPASTAFVQQELNTFQINAFTATGTIDVDDGRVVTFTGASGQTLTLPAAGVGDRIEIWNIDTVDVVTIARAGSDTITDFVTPSATSFKIPPGAKAMFECLGTGVWHASYTTTVVKTGEFQPGSGTGNKSETGIGFRPKLVTFTMDTGNNGAVSRTMSGWFDSYANQFTTCTLNVGSDTNMYSNSAACISTVTTAGAATDLATVVSVDVDGFTVNFSANGTSSDWFYTATA